MYISKLPNVISKLTNVISKLTNVFVLIDKHISPNCQMYLSKLINVFIPVAKHFCPKGCAKWNWGFWQTTVLTPVLQINIAIYIWKILFLSPPCHNHSQPFSTPWITETVSLIWLVWVFGKSMFIYCVGFVWVWCQPNFQPYNHPTALQPHNFLEMTPATAFELPKQIFWQQKFSGGSRRGRW